MKQKESQGIEVASVCGACGTANVMLHNQGMVLLKSGNCEHFEALLRHKRPMVAMLEVAKLTPSCDNSS